ncbi:flagellar type III secretion system pore protein FliP [Kineosporia babensis]|uniref:Flagellar biosynthetic protein FliP n=1 Tax=Kineosporia babensis TaxID=499548 RepID=A0A9X1N7L9_9ACTN|nr:flagellar type III secretion system pore protein FliP [Kineosporia babensis]MCD5309847.1 flagellar type III secretion system pore protein FliP [Kineosporia babensis]
MDGHSPRKGLRPALRLLAGLMLGVAFLMLSSGTAQAAPAPATNPATAPIAAAVGTVQANTIQPGDQEISVSVPGQRSQVLSIILMVTLIGVAPSILLMCTSFTKIVVVLSLTRSALGTPSVPPNQVLVGLALFLSLFIMGPTVDAINDAAIQPYSSGDMNITEAYRAGTDPMREFMLRFTRDEELALMTKAADLPFPENRESVDLRTLVPAFVLSELRGAFIIGFVIFIPFLVIDIVVSAILMSLGMVMLPPALVSLPFKLLLFVLVDGWTLIVTTLIGSYR